MGYSKVVLNGRFTKDPELRQTQSGVSVCRFCLAVGRTYNKDEVDFINCVAWRNTAEFVARYFKRSDGVLVDGSIESILRESTVPNQKAPFRHTEWQVVVDKVNFVEGEKREKMAAPVCSETQKTGFEVVEDDADLPF